MNSSHQNERQAETQRRWRFTVRDAAISVTGICLSLAMRQIFEMPLSFWLAVATFAGSIGYFIGRITDN